MALILSASEDHPELFHYTGIDGLKGIVKSQTLRATHATYLSDTTEILAFQDRLPALLNPAVTKIIRDFSRQSTANKILVANIGGETKAPSAISTRITTAMFRALFGSSDIEPFSEPYVTSFCTPATEEISAHGLLSQWRGYGQGGGYAIVFDTARLKIFLKEEYEKWRYSLFLGDVIYSSESDEKIREEFGPHLDQLATSIKNWLITRGADEALETTFDPLTRCACRYKHWGFHEEKEKRIVALLQHNHISSAEKPRNIFTRGSAPIPCIYLFEGITDLPRKPLPITRIIVGPHGKIDSNLRDVGSILKECRLDIPVSKSDIPYVNHSG